MSSSGISRYEQETIVNYNNEEKIATICSRDPVVLRKLAKLAEKYPNAYILVDENSLGKTYECSKKLIRFGAPPRELSEEEKERNRQHLAKYAFKKQS